VRRSIQLSARVFRMALVEDISAAYAAWVAPAQQEIEKVARSSGLLEKAMKSAKLMAAISLSVFLMAWAPRSSAQNEPVANPLSSSVKSQLTRSSKNMVAAAEAMPADKFGFKPTPDMMTFGHLLIHIADTNTTLCSKLSGTPAPDGKLEETDGKDKLVAGLKASFDFCTSALGNVDDAKLGEQIAVFGGRMVPRAAAWLILSGSWADHYSTEAVYLRLNGILPPTAQAKK
jgi:DinB superfamily